jgi:cell division protein FtsB
VTPKQWKRLFARITLLSVLFVGAVLIVLLSLATWHLYIKERAAREGHLEEAKSLSELQNRKATIESQLKQLDTDRGIEEEVRTRYPLLKPGEEEIMLVASKPTSTSTSEKKGFWGTFFGWLPW